jgi:hypothetical protein
MKPITRPIKQIYSKTNDLGLYYNNGVEKLEYISGTVNAESYIRTLEECLKMSLGQLSANTKLHFRARLYPMSHGQMYEYDTGLM